MYYSLSFRTGTSRYGKLGFALLGLGSQVGFEQLPTFVASLSVGSGESNGAWPAIATAEDPRAIKGPNDQYGCVQGETAIYIVLSSAHI